MIKGLKGTAMNRLIVSFRRFNSTDITHSLSSRNKLTGTGNGPFIELPTFEPIGKTVTNLLSVKMPQSSNLCIKYGNIIGINGNLDSLSRVNRKLNEEYYQILQSEESVSLLIGGNQHSNQLNHYKILNIEDKSESWIVLRENNLIAWTGYDFDIESCNVLEKFNSIKTIGKGTILLNNGNKHLTIDLGPEEKIYVNPSNLIAYNGGEVILRVLNNRLALYPRITTIINHIKSWQWVKSITSLLIYKYLKPLSMITTPVLVEVEGPRTLLISNDLTASNTKVFTVNELNGLE